MTLSLRDGQYIQLLESKGIIARGMDNSEQKKVAVLFPGHGSQYQNMLLKLRDSFESVKRILDKADDLYGLLTGKALTNYWTAERINEPVILQPTIYTANLAMHSLLQEEGIPGDFLLGHSLGEISALAAAGTISFEDGFKICYFRAKALDNLSPQQSGKMVSIQGDPGEDYVTEFLSGNKNSRVSIINSPAQFVISGTDAEVENLKCLCEKKQITHHVLPIPFPFHSPLLQDASEEFLNQIKTIIFSPNKAPVYSTILQRFYEPLDFFGDNMAGILASQLIKPFSFVDSIRELHSRGAGVFIECGPNNILSRLVSATIDDVNKLVVYMNSSREDDNLTIAKFKAKAALNLDNRKAGGNKGMKSTLFNTISTLTGYPLAIIEKHITQCKDSNITKALAITPVTETEILKRINAVFPAANPLSLNSVILDTKSAAADSGSAEQKKEVSDTAVTIDEVMTYFKETISEKTGYPVELLDENADLEADLGIDSVKQAEVVGKIREHYGYELDPDVKLKDYPNITALAGYVVNRISGNKDAAVYNDIAPVKNSAAVTSSEEIVSLVKDVISEKTGYPVELLDTDADLEADLGIDSVKQAEIIGKIREHYGYELDPNAKVKDYPNIKLMSEYVLSRLNEGTGEQKKKNGSLIDELPEYSTCRYSATTLSANLSDEDSYVLTGKKILVIGDLSDETVKETEAALLKNNSVVSLNTCSKQQPYIDFLDSAQLVDALEKAVGKLGGLDCVVNLQALDEGKDINGYPSVSEFEDAYKRIYNGLFYSSKVCYPYFENNKDAAYFAATSIGDYFGVEHKRLHNPLGAVTSGFIKALEKELRPFIVKVVDIDNLAEEGICDLLINEFSHYSHNVEIGYVNGIRKCVITVKDELLQDDVADITSLLESGDSVLVTGGGRGITYECAEALLSKIGRPVRVYLTGRTPVPSGTEEWLQMSETDFNNYKSAFMLEKKKERPNLKGFEIQQEYAKLKNARELYDNLERLRKGGHNVDYIACDFSSESDVKNLYSVISGNGSRIMGIINGAGLPSFGKVPGKNEFAAYKVLQLKANSMYFINKYFLNSDTKFVVNMGSISGRFGMDGQVDYSAAADFLVKLNKNLAESYENCKFICIGWPAWDSVGMAASEEVMKVQKEGRGLSYISVKEGRVQFIKELSACNNTKCEYLYFGRLGKLNMPLGQLDYEEGPPKLSAAHMDGTEELSVKFLLIDQVHSCGDDHIHVTRKLDFQRDRHLEEHKVDGHSVLAGVYHIELACELFKLYTQLIHKEDFTVSMVKDYNFYEFIKYFEGNPLTISAHGEVVKNTEDELILKIQLKSDFINKQGVVLRKDRLHSEGIIIGTKNLTQKAAADNAVQSKETVTPAGKGAPINLSKYYTMGEKFIYFGENFRNISNVIIAEDMDHITGEVKVTDEGIVFGSHTSGLSIISPIVVDNIGRLMLLNEFDKYGYSIVPTCIGSAEKIRDFITGEVLYVDCVKVSEQGDKVTYDARAYDKDKQAVFIIRNMTLTRIGKTEGDHNLKD